MVSALLQAIEAAAVRPVRAPAERPLAADVRASGLEWSLAALIFAASFTFRFLDPGFINDNFREYAQGRQVLVYRELPFRDFVDPGIFLHILTSAGLQLLFGHNLLGEALLCVSLLSAGAALTFVLAARASHSWVIGAITALFVTAMYPRLDSYPKIFFHLLALALLWRYIDRPTPRLLGLIGLLTAVAFLFRHDHGVYIGAGTGVMLIAAHWNDGYRVLVRRLALYAAAAALPLAPFFLFLEANGGVVEYFRSAAEYGRSEAGRQRLFGVPRSAIDPTAPLLSIGPPRRHRRLRSGSAGRTV